MSQCLTCIFLNFQCRSAVTVLISFLNSPYLSIDVTKTNPFTFWQAAFIFFEIVLIPNWCWFIDSTCKYEIWFSRKSIRNSLSFSPLKIQIRHIVWKSNWTILITIVVCEYVSLITLHVLYSIKCITFALIFYVSNILLYEEILLWCSVYHLFATSEEVFCL